MISVRTQDRMALVPYKSCIQIIVLDDYDKKTNDEIALLHIELARIRNTMYTQLSRPKEDYYDDIGKKIIILQDSATKKAILEEQESGYTLGVYETKKRALQVLDEIQEILNKDDYEIVEKEYEFTNEQMLEFEASNYVPQKYYQERVIVSKVYQMPKE